MSAVLDDHKLDRAGDAERKELRVGRRDEQVQERKLVHAGKRAVFSLVRNRDQSEPRGDVYSLGITLYELVTLRPAFADSERLRLIQRVADEPPRPPRS